MDNTLIIEVNDDIREKFAEEVVNISVQYRLLLKRHDRRFRNMMKEYKVLLIVLCVMLVFYLIGVFTWLSSEPYSWMICLVLAVLSIVYFSVIRNLNKTYRGILSQKGCSVITLDENGAELNRQNSQVLRMSWDNIAFVRLFKESICFFSKEPNGMLIIADIRHADAIIRWLRENRPDTELIF